MMNLLNFTHYPDDKGRYVVALPFKDTLTLNFGNNREMGLSRFYNLERRLVKYPKLYGEYSKFLHEYEHLNHMSITDKPAAFIIPHHSVVKASSSSTKLRVVFDASAKPYGVNSNIRSLNECLRAGPKLQLDLSDIILAFRLHKIAFTCDICKMYRQIVIRPSDRKFQHIFWRASSN